MAVAITLQPIPDLPTRVVQPGDVTIGDGDTITVPLNRQGDIIEQGVAKQTFTYNVRGLTGSEVLLLRDTADNNLLELINGNDPSFATIVLSGLTFDRCYLRQVRPSGSISINGNQVVDSTQVIYETIDRFLI